MLQICVWEMYLVGAFISGWMKMRRGRIVTVGIMIAIVLLGDGRGEYLRVDIMQVSFVWLFLLVFVFRTTMLLMG